MERGVGGHSCRPKSPYLLQKVPPRPGPLACVGVCACACRVRVQGPGREVRVCVRGHPCRACVLSVSVGTPAALGRLSQRRGFRGAGQEFGPRFCGGERDGQSRRGDGGACPRVTLAAAPKGLGVWGAVETGRAPCKYGPRVVRESHATRPIVTSLPDLQLTVHATWPTESGPSLEFTSPAPSPSIKLCLQPPAPRLQACSVLGVAGHSWEI